MKARLFRLPLLIALLAFFIPAIQPSAFAQTDNWNVAVLDQILAGVQPGQKLAQIGDMQVLVSRLAAWRNQLAGLPSTQSAFDGIAATWPDGDVYYSFSDSGTNAVPADLQAAFLNAAADWAMFANLRFIPRTTQANYVTVQVETGLEGGLSAVGMVGGQQFLSISPDAWNRGTMCHEIGHTLGLVHEHQRSDRDNFVTILTNNIVPGGLGNFVLLSDSRNQGDYDFLSVMHYARNYLSTSASLDTIEPQPAYIQFINLMGQPGPTTLSVGDRAGMAQVYGPAPPLSSIVTNTLDTGPGSLRAALYFAFDHPGTHITFNIPTNDPGYSNGVFTIQPSDQLPWLVNATDLDGSTEPTNAGSAPSGPLIVINGGSAPRPSTYANGLYFGGTNCTVRSLVINGFAASGVLITNAASNTLAGCYLGTDATGEFAVTNGLAPLTIGNGATGNIIGGITASNRNVISGGVFQGVVIAGSGATGNLIQGNYIGLNATGTAALPNGFSGVGLVGGAQGNIIGGSVPGAGNVISGNSIQGIALRDPGTANNLIEGNFIGLDPSGTVAIPNAAAAIEIFLGAQSNMIGGTLPGMRNIISGNSVQGVLIDGAGTTGNQVQGNYIGLNPAGTAAISNVEAGVGIFGAAQSNIIGGASPAMRNIISGNGLQGVAIGNAGTTGNVVEGNYLGLDPTGTTAIPNAASGVNLFDGAQGNNIGGVASGAGNVISGNSLQGVALQDSGTANNFIQGNFIGLNAAGAAAVPNLSCGVELFANAGANVVGGGNFVSGNGGDGVLLDNGASSNTVEGNFIGLDAAGNTAIPNAGAGVEMFVGANANLIGGIGGRNFISGNSLSGILIDDGACSEMVQDNTIGLNVFNASVPNLNAGIGLFGGAQSNIIGGTLPGEANLIADNAGGGVELYYTNTVDNDIRGNSIYGNGSGYGIFLFLANNSAIESAPALTAAVLATNTTISGNLASLPGTIFHLDFYANPPTASMPQATTYLGAHDVATGGNGTVNFIIPVASPVPLGHIVTATATDPAGNTSQLSAGVAVTGVDSVGDGISDAWRQAHFGGNGATTNSLSCATCDPGHDGFDNLQAFYAGTDPNNPAGVLRVGTVAANGADLNVNFLSMQGIVYRVEFRDQLASGVWMLLADQILGTGGDMQITDPGAAILPARFYRVDVLP